MIVDTNAISALADDAAGVTSVLRGFRLAVPVVVVGEFRYGIAHSRRYLSYQSWLEEFLAISDVLEVNLATAHRYSEIRSELRRSGKSIPANDAWIAALARQHDMPIASRDAHFDLVAGIRRVTW